MKKKEKEREPEPVIEEEEGIIHEEARHTTSVIRNEVKEEEKEREPEPVIGENNNTGALAKEIEENHQQEEETYQGILSLTLYTHTHTLFSFYLLFNGFIRHIKKSII